MSYCPLSTVPLSPGTVVKSSGEVTQREVRAWVKDEVGDLDLSQLDLDREQFQYNKILQIGIKTSVGDTDPNPEPDPPDPHVFEPPGFGSRYFYHHAKKIRKTLIPTIL
jgi:hypothetical protein